MALGTSTTTSPRCTRGSDRSAGAVPRSPQPVPQSCLPSWFTWCFSPH